MLSPSEEAAGTGLGWWTFWVAVGQGWLPHIPDPSLFHAWKLKAPQQSESIVLQWTKVVCGNPPLLPLFAALASWDTVQMGKEELLLCPGPCPLSPASFLCSFNGTTGDKIWRKMTDLPWSWIFERVTTSLCLASLVGKRVSRRGVSMSTESVRACARPGPAPKFLIRRREERGWGAQILAFSVLLQRRSSHSTAQNCYKNHLLSTHLSSLKHWQLGVSFCWMS